MCGIVGYIGPRQAEPILIDGLSKLEYRGYDSAGIAVYDQGNLTVAKIKGRLANLQEMLKDRVPQGTCGIGHTRWATHGAPSDFNSHPHTNMSGSIAIVHNGIIENYIKLKAELQAEGVTFRSDTDTEVVAHLIDKYFAGDLPEAVRQAAKRLEGSYALSVVCTDAPDMIVAVRKNSPLIVGLGQGEYFVASDIPAILEYTRDIYLLDEDEMAVVTREGVKTYDADGKETHKDVFQVKWDVAAAEKGGFDHFMLKEIHEEPKVVDDTIHSRLDRKTGEIDLSEVKLDEEAIKGIKRIVIVACGTAYHAGIVGRYLIEKFARIPVVVDIASEFRYKNPILLPDDLMLVISQSGETADTLAAVREAKRQGCKVLAIANVVGSTITRESDFVFYTWAGPEIAVASTKAYNTQVLAMSMLAAKLAITKGTITREVYDQMVGEIVKMPEYLKQVIAKKDEAKAFAQQFHNANSIFFLGRGIDYAVAMEGSLKLKEISYINSEAYAAGELKHGTIALIEEGTPVVALITQPDLYEKMVSNIREVKARGAVVLAIAPEDYAEIRDVADGVLTIPATFRDFSPILSVTYTQLFAYYTSVIKGCDVDKPRNLAKSVTVE